MNDINDDVWIWFKFQCMNIFESSSFYFYFNLGWTISWTSREIRAQKTVNLIPLNSKYLNYFCSTKLFMGRFQGIAINLISANNSLRLWNRFTKSHQHQRKRFHGFSFVTKEKKWWQRKNSRKHIALDNLKRMKINTMKRRKRANDRKQCVVIIAEQGPRIEIVWNLFSYNIKY